MEVWKWIPGFTGYYKVSDKGRVKSVTRHNHYVRLGTPVIRTDHGRIMQTPSGDHGYPIVCLYKKGRRETVDVHVLVARVFVPNPKNLPEVNHKNFNRADNRYTNLEWRSRKGNVGHYWKAVYAGKRKRKQRYGGK